MIILTMMIWLATITLNNDTMFKVNYSFKVGNKYLMKEICKVDQDGVYSRGRLFTRLSCDQFKEQLLQMQDEKVMICYTLDKSCNAAIKSKED